MWQPQYRCYPATNISNFTAEAQRQKHCAATAAFVIKPLYPIKELSCLCSASSASAYILYTSGLLEGLSLHVLAFETEHCLAPLQWSTGIGSKHQSLMQVRLANFISHGLQVRFNHPYIVINPSTTGQFVQIMTDFSLPKYCRFQKFRF